jgi:hypothetical protein
VNISCGSGYRSRDRRLSAWPDQSAAQTRPTRNRCEFRHDLLLLLQGPVQAVAFVDAQRITINHSVWLAGTNAASLKGAGLGLTWSGGHAWSAKTYLAAPVGATPVLIGVNNSLRIWGEISKGF